MGKAMLDVSCELLADVLMLPGDTDVVQATWAPLPRTIRLVIEGAEVPDAKAGDPCPVVTAEYQKVDGKISFVRWR